MTPSVGRIVHYVSHGTPPRPDGSQAFASECRAAIVTEVSDDHTVGLCVLNPTGQFFNRGVVQHEMPPIPEDQDMVPWKDLSLAQNHPGGTWHWPERVEG